MTAGPALPQSVDVAIVGGGMVGLSLALLLARANAGLRIGVFEARPVTLGDDCDWPPSFDARSTALSESTREIFAGAGLWSDLAAHAAAIETIHVSDRSHAGATRLEAREAGVAALGHVVENRLLGRVLLAAVDACPGVKLIAPVNVERLRPAADGMVLHCGEQRCRAGLAVVADGAGSALLPTLGIHTRVTDYRQAAVIANVGLARPHTGVAYERFTDSGPAALLPLPPAAGEQRAALVWTAAPDVAAELVACDEDMFLRRLHERFGFRAGRFYRCGERTSYPLQLSVAEEQVRRHLVVMGNAAHYLHPVAGQGFNLAMRDVARLCESVTHSCRRGAGPGELAALQDYIAAQQVDQRNTIGFSHYLPAIFGRPDRGTAALRSAGLIALDLVPPLRRQFARFGAGLEYPASKLPLEGMP